MDRKCINCTWEGKEEDTVTPLNHCPVCGDNTIETKVITKKVETKAPKKESKTNFDLDGDGDVDNDDRSIAAKLLGSKKGKAKKKTVNKKRK